ncbi:hypothetical protein [Tsukamurella tyrosinosolvens]|uniref:hypothetical protein n=1 Tax=Tsukamurella tyrosinosolvens TaxID=57704 RepID=UPI000DF6E4E6|nr:hypothetical protein [Tsukamurella tyrosinosolvens]RDB44942.1 hypothetical protein DVB87_25990 [Tsukamurella tyrosinosolvens]
MTAPTMKYLGNPILGGAGKCGSGSTRFYPDEEFRRTLTINGDAQSWQVDHCPTCPGHSILKIHVALAEPEGGEYDGRVGPRPLPFSWMCAECRTEHISEAMTISEDDLRAERQKQNALSAFIEAQENKARRAHRVIVWRFWWELGCLTDKECVGCGSLASRLRARFAD